MRSCSLRGTGADSIIQYKNLVAKDTNCIRESITVGSGCLFGGLKVQV